MKPRPGDIVAIEFLDHTDVEAGQPEAAFPITTYGRLVFINSHTLLIDHWHPTNMLDWDDREHLRRSSCLDTIALAVKAVSKITVLEPVS
jgi:hypothetical protein